LPTNYNARETSLVSYKHNRKTNRWLAHLCFLPRSTRLLGRWTRPSVLSCFSHLGWINLEERERAMGFQIGTTNHTKVIILECTSRNWPKCNHFIYDYMRLLVICNYI
jgi:hypothetical protein